MSILRTFAAATLAAGVATVAVAILAMTTSSARLTSLATSTAVLTGVFAELEPDEYARLVGDIIALARLKRPSGAYEVMDLDGDFSEDFGAIIPVVAFVLKEVFGDFFSAAPGSGNRGVAGRA